MSLRFDMKRLWLLGDSIAKRNGHFAQRRRQSAIAGPPRNSLKTWEMFFYGGGMAIGVLYLPVYSIYHLREYAGTKNPPED